MKGRETAMAASVWVGRSAALIGAFLCWYAVWTVECTLVVLLGGHYPWLLWAPLLPTLTVILYWRRWGADIVRRYGGCPDPVAPAVALRGGDWTVLAGAALACLVAADIGNRVPTALPYMIAVCLVAGAIFQIDRRRRPTTGVATANADTAVGRQLALLTIGLFGIYYCAHKPDADDANFVNLAIGVKRTIGSVFQYDTMLGDGRSPIHLPTYKFHSFELLAAVLSSYTAMSPLVVLHLILPALLLPILAAVLLTIFFPALGRYWLAGVLLWMALLVVDIGSLAGWGVHGVTRFFQGKGFYVTALLPLIAALTMRWMRRGEKSDLAALTVAQVCAVGFSANGIYGGPAASGLVVLAYLVASPRDMCVWKRALSIIPTLAWPLIVAGSIIAFHLALPSEVTTPTIAIAQLNFVSAFGIVGRVLLVLLAFTAFGLWRAGLGRPGILYVAVAMLVILNPLGWRIVSAITGNLGFRIFWSIPLPMLAAITGMVFLRLFPAFSPRVAIGVAALILASAVAYDHLSADADRIQWRIPDLKVDRADYDVARRLARETAPQCAILAPERYAQFISMIEGAPYPVFVRKLYLVHYRFTLPAAERGVRERLRRLVEGEGNAVPAARDLAEAGIAIGTVAIDRHAASHPAAARLANNLRLTDYRREGTLDVWSGACDA